MTRRQPVFSALMASALLVAGCQGTASSSPSAGEPTSSLVPTATPSASASLGATGWNLVTIGDSIAYAQEDCGGCPSFTTLFAQAITRTTGRPVQADNLSTRDNLTGKGLVDRIRTSDPMRTAVAAADILVVNIGHNDTPWSSRDDPCDGDNGDQLNWSSYTGPCVVQLAQRHGEELDAILTEIETLRAGKPTAVRVLTDYNDQTGFEFASPESIAPAVEVVDAFHAVTCPAAEAHGAVCVDVYHSFNGADGRAAAGQLLASDYTSPSALGQARIADLLGQAGLAPLVP